MLARILKTLSNYLAHDEPIAPPSGVSFYLLTIVRPDAKFAAYPGVPTYSGYF
jgi:hypothetical protein